MLAPLLTTLSSSAIQVSFFSPLRPQGNITIYTITRISPAPPTSQVFTFTPLTLPPLDDDGAYVFNDTGLLPFTNYTYALRVCTRGGCTDSDPSTELTLEDMPTGVDTPTTVVIAFDEIVVEWVEPSMPNGEILMYDLFRRSHGFDNDTGAGDNCCEAYLQQDASQLPGDCSRVTTTSQRMHVDQNLSPYSFYSYCLVATNNAASGSGPQTTPTQTSPAPMPLAGVSLNATAINSTAIFLEWDMLAVSDLLGPLEGYRLYARVARAPGGLGGVVFEGSEQSYSATGLLASTEYVFVVEVSNGAGSSFSNNASATTLEGSEFNDWEGEVEIVYVCMYACMFCIRMQYPVVRTHTYLFSLCIAMDTSLVPYSASVLRTPSIVRTLVLVLY